MSTPKLQTPTSIGRSRLGVFSPAQRVLRPDMESKVRVVVRVRPFLPMEIEAAKANPKSCITIAKANGNLQRDDTLHIQDFKTGRNECYKLDSCYGQEDDVGQIFTEEVRPILPALFRGSNATVFTYGATGSGKTYTMQGTEDRPGLMPLAMMSILSMAEETESRVEISYYEVYMDRCYDLLEPKAKEVLVLDDSEGRVQLRGLAQVRVSSLDEFQEVFTYGCMRRKVGHTGLNDVSSRSHGVLMISVSSDDGNPDMPLVGKLNLIDLAGNEDNRRTGNEGTRLTESVRINQSLFALSNVIHALNANESRVPYRDSKLTRILQDSLGGTSRALMIACLNPRSYQEALHTVNLAARSRQIVNHVASDGKPDTPKQKVDMGARLQSWLEARGKSNGKAPPNGSPTVGKPPSPFHPKQTPTRLQLALKASASMPKGRSLFGPPIRVKMDSNEATNPATNTSEKCTKPHLSKDGESAAMEMPASNTQSKEDHKNGTSSTNIHLENINHADSPAHVVNEFKHTAYEHDESIDKENKMFPEKFLDGSSPPLSARLKQLHSSLKDMLTPLAANIDKNLSENPTACGQVQTSISFNVDKPVPGKVSVFGHTTPISSIIDGPTADNVAFSGNLLTPTSMKGRPLSENAFVCDQSCGMTLELASPKTPQVSKEVKEETPKPGTPLETFSARSSGLKQTLAREYMHFLNTASREELLELKGIGEKRANYILELRETSPEPLKELQDLEKIGLTSKQIQTMFRTTARHIFA